MSSRRCGGLAALALLAAIPLLTAPPAQAGGFGFFGKKREEPKPPVILLAERIDEIEESLNETGTIVAKKPDVWGESRMTKHRQEVEEELAKRVGKFELLLNASVSRSDAAFFANTFALQAALGGGGLPDLPSPADPTAASSLIIQNPAGGAGNSDVLVRTTPGAMQIATRTGEAADGALGFATTGIGLEPTIQLDQLKRYLDHLNELRRLNEGGDTADAPGYALNLVRIPVSVLPGDETRIGHGAEITITAETHLTPELLPTAFRTLVIQDLVDQLALPVLKIAEAKAWEKRPDPTRAAEFKIAESYLVQAKELAKRLATNAAFVKDAFVKDGGDKDACFPDGAITALITHAKLIHGHLVEVESRLPDGRTRQAVTAQIEVIGKRIEELKALRVEGEGVARDEEDLNKAKPTRDFFQNWLDRRNSVPEEGRSEPSSDEAAKDGPAIAPQPDGTPRPVEPGAETPGSAEDATAKAARGQAKAALSNLKQAEPQVIERFQSLKDVRPEELSPEQVEKFIDEFEDKKTKLGTRKKKLREEINRKLESQAKVFSDLPATIESLTNSLVQLVQEIETVVIDVEQAIAGAVTSLPSASSSPRVARYAVPPSRIVEVFGDQELLTIAEAFDRFRERECAGVVHLSDARAFLAEELQAAYDFLLSPNGVGHWTCAPELALSLRGGEVPVEQRVAVSECGRTVVRSLAWAVLVEAALLNERLNEDMQRVSGDPECNCMYGGPYVFLGPDPPIDARYAFVEYVRCRWPIQVFALDPVNQDQNIADEFSLRRELQLSAAVALASGSISASDAMRFTRQIALDQETIALNTTAAAFAHGANTFGWRFYPRFQTADIESNSTVLFRDLFVGGPQRDHLIRDYRIESGMRECVALVVMPSFVPHVRFDIRSNWFQLTDPEDTESSMTETVEMSRKIRDMQRLAEICTVEADNYRPGETERLLARVKQLSDKMPLQTVYAQVPYENTAGGFELFSSGVTDLGPELIDFYGAPGVGKARDTELFLERFYFSRVL